MLYLFEVKGWSPREDSTAVLSGLVGPAFPIVMVLVPALVQLKSQVFDLIPGQLIILPALALCRVQNAQFWYLGRWVATHVQPPHITAE